MIYIISQLVSVVVVLKWHAFVMISKIDVTLFGII